MSNLFRSAGPRTGVRSCLFRSSDPVGRSSLFRSSEPRGWVGVILGFSLVAASLLVKSSKPMDFLECCLSLRHCSHLLERCLRLRYSEPRDVGVARLALILHPVRSLPVRSSKILDFLLSAASLLVRSSKPEDFLECCLSWCHCSNFLECCLSWHCCCN